MATRASLALPAVAAILGFAPPAHGDGLDYGADLGIGESDNVTLAPSNKVSQTIATADLDFKLKERQGHLNEDVSGNFTYLDFLQNAYASQFLGRLNGAAQYALIPGHLVWNLQDNWGQVVTDPFLALVPTNQENVNYLSSGPDWQTRLGGSSFFNASAWYALAQYQVSPIDSSRILGSVEIGRDLSPLSAVSLNGTVQRVFFKNTRVNTDYDLSTAYARYALHGARSEIEFDAGATMITSGASSNSGSLVGLELTRRITVDSSLTVSAGRRLTDASSEFNNLQSGSAAGGANVNSTLGAGPSLVSSSVFTSTYGAVGWQYARNRTSLALNARWETDRFVQDAQLNGSRILFTFNAERKLSHTLSAQLYGNLNRYHYDHNQFVTDAAGFSDLDTLLGAALTLRKGRGLEIRLRYSHVSRDVTDGTTPGYHENRVFLTVGYRPTPRGV